MPLWRSTDSANGAPKFLGVLAKDKSYAQVANVVTTGTFTQGSNVISSLATTTGVNINQLISSSTVLANVSPGAIVTAVINSSAVQMSQTFAGTTATGAAVTFQNDGVRGYNLYQNTTPGAFINNMTVGLWNLLNIPNYVTITANTISGNNILTNPTAGFSNTQTGAVTQSNNIMIVTSTANIIPGQAIYSTAANTTGGSPVWANNVAVANVINSTAVLLSAPSTLTNAAASFYFSNIAPGMIAAGNNLPALSSNTGTYSTAVTTITGTISNGTIGSNGNILNVTAFTGPPLGIGQELLANSTLAIANGTYVVSSTATNGIGNYVLSSNSISNGASGAAISMSTVIPKVVSVNATAIVLSANAYAIGSATGNTVTFSTYEMTASNVGATSAGWVEVKYGTGPVASFGVNSTATSGYSNGETVIVSGGTANALGVITTNTGSGQVGANIASIAVAYPGSGFTNSSSLTYTYQHQLHLANVTISGSPTGAFANGDTINVTCTYPLANITGYITGTILTVTNNQTGTLSVGNILKGGATFTANLINGNNQLTNLSSNAGIIPGQLITSTTSGIATGTVVTSVNSTVVVMSSPFTGTNTTSASVTTAIASNTQILSQLSGSSGGNGTYALSTSQFVANSANVFNNFVSTGQIVAAVATVVNSAAAVANNLVNVSSVGLFTSGLTAANLVFTYSNTGGGTYTTGYTFGGSFATVSSGASANAVLGGRANRVTSETIVALTGTSPYVTENAADNNTIPNS